MKSWWMACVALSALSGCAPEKVRNVVVDNGAYMRSHFGVGDLPSQIRRTVEAGDHVPLPFQRMVLHIAWKYHDVARNLNYTVDATATWTNAGSGLVQVLHEYSRNGVPTSQMAEISYRGIQALRAQDVAYERQVVDPPTELKSFTHFDVLGAGDFGRTLDYQFTFAPAPQIMNFKTGRNLCVFGSVSAASLLNAAFDGNMQQIDCTEYNTNGVVRGHSRFAYLIKYGVALGLHSRSADHTTDGTIIKATII